MEIGRYVLVWICVCSATVSAKAAITGGKVRQGSGPNAFFLSCPVGYNITYINVTSGRNEGCHGETPSLTEQKQNCYWHQNCTLQLPKDSIVKIDDPKDFACFGEVPNFLEVFGVRCFTNTSRVYEAFDICAQKELAFKGAIIKSHYVYPWDYDSGEKACNLTLYHRVDTRLIVTVQEVELGEEDALRMLTGSNVIDLSEVGNEHTEELSTAAAQTVVEFKVDKDSNGGKGFLLCYKFATLKDDVTNACDAVTTPGEVTMTEVSTPDPFMNILNIVVTQTNTAAPEKPCKRRKKNKKCKRPKKNRGKPKGRRNKNKDGKRRRKNRRPVEA